MMDPRVVYLGPSQSSDCNGSWGTSYQGLQKRAHTHTRTHMQTHSQEKRRLRVWRTIWGLKLSIQQRTFPSEVKKLVKLSEIRDYRAKLIFKNLLLESITPFKTIWIILQQTAFELAQYFIKQFLSVTQQPNIRNAIQFFHSFPFCYHKYVQKFIYKL